MNPGCDYEPKDVVSNAKALSNVPGVRSSSLLQIETFAGGREREAAPLVKNKIDTSAVCAFPPLSKGDGTATSRAVLCSLGTILNIAVPNTYEEARKMYAMFANEIDMADFDDMSATISSLRILSYSGERSPPRV